MKHINAAERNSEDPEKREKAEESFNYLSRRLPVGSKVYIISRNLDKYGRPVVEIYFNSDYINQEMLDKGYAVPFM